MNDFSEIPYTATNWLHAAKVLVPYPLGTRQYMFDVAAIQEIEIAGTIFLTSGTEFSITFGAAQFEVLNNTGATIDGNVIFRLQLLLRQPTTPTGSSFLLEFADRSLFPPLGATKTIYIDTSTNNMYRWDTTQYVFLPGLIDADTAPGDDY